jgi:hypothetical protein
MHTLELLPRDKSQINAAYERTEDVSKKVEAACEKVLTRHGVEGFHGPYSLTWNHGESTVTLEYFTG